MHYSLFSGIYKIGYDDHLEVVRYPTLQLLQPYSWHKTLFLACCCTWVEWETNEVTNLAILFWLPMQSAPVRYLIGLGYATRPKRLRTTAVTRLQAVNYLLLHNISTKSYFGSGHTCNPDQIDVNILHHYLHCLQLLQFLFLHLASKKIWFQIWYESISFVVKNIELPSKI